MKQRYILFGYQVAEGEITPHPVESELVRQIYRLYLNGASYSEIAKAMNKNGYPYSENTEGWNKNMVGRILQNRKYIGDAKYFALIESVDLEKATALQQNKFTRKNIKTSSVTQVLKMKVYCGECGGIYHRGLDSRVGEKWNCKNAPCNSNTKITDKILASATTTMLNIAIENPSLIKTSTVQEMPLSLEITRLHNEINREIDKPDCNEDYVKKLIMACAVEKYNLCDDGSPQRISRKIKDVFTNHIPITEFDVDLFTATVDKVLVYQDGNISIKLKNNQMLGKER